MNSSRTTILKWLAGLGIHAEKIEDVGKGVILCKILRKMDPAFPRFKEECSREDEYMHNLKIVQDYMERKGMKLVFPVERMCKLRMQDNLEVIQWFYKRYKDAGPEDTQSVDVCTIERTAKVERLREAAMVLQKERDFYFNKLSQIEKLLKDESFVLSNETKKDILALMYDDEQC